MEKMAWEKNNIACSDLVPVGVNERRGGRAGAQAQQIPHSPRASSQLLRNTSLISFSKTTGNPPCRELSMRRAYFLGLYASINRYLACNFSSTLLVDTSWDSPAPYAEGSIMLP